MILLPPLLTPLYNKPCNQRNPYEEGNIPSRFRCQDIRPWSSFRNSLNSSNAANLSATFGAIPRRFDQFPASFHLSLQTKYAIRTTNDRSDAFIKCKRSFLFRYCNSRVYDSSIHTLKMSKDRVHTKDRSHLMSSL